MVWGTGLGHKETQDVAPAKSQGNGFMIACRAVRLLAWKDQEFHQPICAVGSQGARLPAETREALPRAGVGSLPSHAGCPPGGSLQPRAERHVLVPPGSTPCTLLTSAKGWALSLYHTLQLFLNGRAVISEESLLDLVQDALVNGDIPTRKGTWSCCSLHSQR